MSRRLEYKVVWAKTASLDLASIIDYIAFQHTINAERVLEKIENKAATLNTMPQRGRVVPELKEWGILLYRELILSPWRILYRISLPNVFVVSVIDSRRNVEDLLLERFVRMG